MNNTYIDYGSYLDWNIGGFLAHDQYLLNLLDLCDKMHLEQPFKYIFGSLPCKWQGGRIAPRIDSLSNIARWIKIFNDHNVGVLFTFSAYNLKEIDLSDDLCNTIIQLLNYNSLNGVIVSSDILKDYIRSKYKNISITASLVKSSHECHYASDEYFNGLTNEYDMVVVPSEYVDNIEFIANLKDPSKIEFIVNHRCLKNCPIAAKHYDTQYNLEQASLSNDKKLIEKYSKELADINTACYNDRFKNPSNYSILNPDQIKYLVSLGFRNFKLEGRDNDGVTMIRDIGNWIFNPYGPYLSMANIIQHMPV